MTTNKIYKTAKEANFNYFKSACETKIKYIKEAMVSNDYNEAYEKGEEYKWKVIDEVLSEALRRSENYLASLIEKENENGK